MILFNLLSNAVTLISRLSQRFCILTKMSSDRVFLIFFEIILLLNVFPSTFYLLEIELDILFLELSCPYLIYLENDLQNFFL
jgi:predicted membrane protein